MNDPLTKLEASVTICEKFLNKSDANCQNGTDSDYSPERQSDTLKYKLKSTSEYFTPSNIKHSPLKEYWVSKCLTVPENGMNIDLNVVKYSDVDFSKKFETK